MSQTQTRATELQSLRTPAEANLPAVAPGFGSLQSFELMQRAAKLLSSSTLVPAAYRAVIEKLDKYGNVKESRENPNALANAVVALNMAQRMGADPLMVMQNLYIVEGRPSWSSQWIIAAINGCGRFSPLRFRIEAKGKKTVEHTSTVWNNGNRETVTKKVEITDKVCVAWAIEKETGEILESPAVSIEMAVLEGWYTKNGSKWQTMDEVMLRYRTASFFGKLYAPELLMGLQSVEEAQDIIDATTGADGTIHVDVETLRSRNSGQGVTAEPKAADATDVELRTQDTPSAEAKAEAGKPAPEAAAAAPADGGGDEVLTCKAVLEKMQRADDLDVLDVAADLIGSVADEEEREELQDFYRRRRAELEGAKKPRRAARGQMNVE